MNNFYKKLVLFGGLLIPLLIFLNRFLLPDLSFDSVNYHVFFGDRFSNFWKFSSFEFFPTGLHSFPPVFDYFGGIFRQFFGYRLGSIVSLVFLYGIIYLLTKIIGLYSKKKIWSEYALVLFFINIFISLEIFFQLGTYYVDIIGAFWVIWSIYLMLLYFKHDDRKMLIGSGVLIGFSVAGKLTNLIYLIPMVLLIGFLELRKSCLVRKKINNLLLFGFFIFLPIGISCVGNFIKTGNPVFPFYNAIFKSKYYSTVSFNNTNFGGRNFLEKLIWPIVSLNIPERLSEGHDLFNDYKLNLYFILLLPSLFFSYRRREKDILFWYFNVFYFLSMMLWNFSFGYLRYAMVLEMLGGLMVYFWVDRLIHKKNIFKVKNFSLLIVLLIVLAVFGYLDKKAININLAYDLSWRKTFTYNRSVYLGEAKNLFINKLSVMELSNNNFPDVFLNCSAPGLAFYSLSQFNMLPVVNIDNRASREMTSNTFYNNEVNRRIFKKSGKNTISFVTIVGRDGLTNQYVSCIETLRDRKFIINEEIPVDDFLGYGDQKLMYIFGEYSL